MSIVEKYKFFLDGYGADDFLNSCFKYDFKQYKQDIEQMSVLYKNYCLGSSNFIMRSNGSTGFNRTYAFGPEIMVVSLTESMMRDSLNTEGLIRLNSSYPFYDTTRFQMTPWPDGSFLMKLDLTSKKSGGFFIDNVKPNSVIETQPNICRMMCCHNEIVDHLRRNNITVFSTCDDCCFNRHTIKARNRMIDWKTGFNFFECEFGCVHFLPLWFEENGKSFNLLNPMNKNGHDISDIFIPNGFRECKCGRTSCDLYFISHFMMKPKARGSRKMDYYAVQELVSITPDRLFNVQFLEFEDHIHIILDECESSDLSFVKDSEQFFDKKAIVHRNKVFRIGGGKMPFVWKTDDLKLNNSSYPII